MTEPHGRSPRQAWREAWIQVWVMLFDHIPLVIGVALTATVHKIRTIVLPTDATAWSRVLDATLVAGEFSLLASLVAPKLVDLAGELGEGSGIAWRRMVHAFCKGKRLPPAPRL